MIFFWQYAKMSLPYAYYVATLCKKQEQASDAGVSRQCLEDKMSKGARNVDIGKFDI